MNSVQEELTKFCETTSMRGVPRIPKSKEKFVKLMWIVMVILCLAVLITFLVVIIQKFSSWPVTTEFKEDLDDVLDFPDVTICSLNRFLNNYRGNVTLNEYFQFMGDFKDNYVSKIIYKSLSSFIRALPKYEFFDGDDCPPFIADCTIYSTDYINVNKCENNFTRIWNFQYHSCYTIRASTLHDSPLGGMVLLINVGPPSISQIPYELNLTTSQSNGIRVIIHSPGTTPNNKRGFDLSPGTENTIRIIQTNVERVGKPYNSRGCTKQKIMPNSTSERYSQDQCLDYCAQYNIYKDCGCLAYWFSMPEYLANISVCGNVSFRANDSEWLVELFKLACAFVANENVSGCMSECLLPCHSKYYESYVVSTSWPAKFQQVGIYQSYFYQCIDNFPEVKKRYAAYEYFSNLYMSEQNISSTNYSINDLKEIGESLLVVKFIIEDDFPYVQINKPLYTWDVMTGLIGGQLSLWLGLSAMTIAEVLEFVYHVAKRVFKTRSCYAPKERQTYVIY